MSHLKVVFIGCFLILGQVQSQEERQTSTTIQKYFGSVTWQTGSGEKSIKCRVSDVESEIEPPGTFEWQLGNNILEDFDMDEMIMIGEGEYEQTLRYEPKIEDDGKVLKCSFKTEDDFGGVLHKTEPDTLTFKIESNKFPKSPVQAGNFLPGQEVEFLVEFEQYPDPKPENVVWIVEGNDGGKQEFTPGKTDDNGKYEASELKSLGEHKFSTTFTILSVDLEEVNKNHFLLVKSTDKKKTEYRVDTGFKVSEAREPAPVTTTTTPAPEQDQDGEGQQGESKEPEAPTQMNVGIIIIMVLVLLIIVICIGYCIYKKYGQKPEPRNDQTAAGKTDPKTGKDYQQAASQDPDNPA